MLSRHCSCRARVTGHSEVEADGCSGAINPSRFNNRVPFILLLLPPSGVFDAILLYTVCISPRIPLWSWDRQPAIRPAAHALPILINSRSLYFISLRRKVSGSNFVKPIITTARYHIRFIFAYVCFCRP
jgi:hypothetical protein